VRGKLVAALIMMPIAVAGCTSAGGTPGGAATSSTARGVIGVTCSGTTSDAATLQNAIDSSPPGAVVAIGGGTCLLTRGISLRGGRTYTGGNAAGTVLKQDAGMDYVLASEAYAAGESTTGDPLAVRDLSIACDGSGGTDGIVVLNWHADVEHVNVSGCGGSGIVDTNTAANGTAIKNTSVNSRFTGNMITGSGRYGFEVRDTGNAVTDGYLEDNQIAGSARDAIHLSNAAGWDISANHLYRDGANGIFAQRLYGTTISGNYIEDFGAGQRPGTWYGIVGTVSGSVGSVIAGNKIFNEGGERPGDRHVFVSVTEAAKTGAGYVSLTGNVVLGAARGDVGMSLRAGPGRLYVASSGNEFAGLTTPRAVTAGVTVTGGI
jgi:hypothetical protein